MQGVQPLSDELAGLIMLKLASVYGRRFTGSYDLTGAELRATWARELAGVSAAGVRYALDRLPADYVPNVLQFRALAAMRPESADRLLPAPVVPPEKIRRFLEPLKALRAGFGGPRDPVAWAERIVSNPKGHTRAAVEMAFDALKAKGRL